MKLRASEIASRFLCAYIPLSIIGLCFDLMRVRSPRGQSIGLKILMVAGVIDLIAIFAVPETLSVGAALVYLFAVLVGIGVYGVTWGIYKAVFVRRHCTMRVAATITNFHTVCVGRSITQLFTATFDHRGQTYEANELSGSVTRAVAGYQPPEPPESSSAPINQEIPKKSWEHLKVGDPCTLLINPHKPTEAMYINEHNVAAGIASALLGAFMAVLCSFGLIYMLAILINAIP